MNFLMNDFIITPDLCNYKCDYCLYKEAPDWEKNNNSNRIKTVYDKEGDNKDFFIKTKGILEKYDSIFKTPILRICGGELFYIKDIMSFIEQIHGNYETVQIISNGHFLDDELLSRIKNLNNCILHISLDGHTLELNSRRLKNSAYQDRLINNIKNVIKMGIPLEIATCLTDANTKRYEEMVSYFYGLEGDVLLLPFPVRGEECKEFYPSSEDKEVFSRILSYFDNYKEILPPYKYLERLCSFFNDGRRREGCHIPKAIIQTFHNGDITACCMDWSVKLGNATKDLSSEIADSICNCKMYNLYSLTPPRLASCRTCFTVSEIINLYIDGQISVEDLQKMKLFAGKESLKLVESIKKI